jgi:hypothetical protein
MHEICQTFCAAHPQNCHISTIDKTIDYFSMLGEKLWNTKFFCTQHGLLAMKGEVMKSTLCRSV